MYDHVEEANNRLLNSIVAYNGEPFLVTEVAGEERDNLIVRGHTLPRGDLMTVNVKDDALSWNNIQVGYMNIGNRAVYLDRRPARRMTQGLCEGNMAEVNAVPGNELRYRAYIVNRGFRDMFCGEYPSVDECVKALSSTDVVSRAFCREFSLVKDDIGLIYLHYKGHRVGWTEDGTEIRIRAASKHLTDICESYKIKVR